MRQFVIHEPRKTIDYQELLGEMKDVSPTKKDYVVDSANIRAVPTDGDIVLSFPRGEGQESVPFEITDWAHGQIALKVGVPKKYYDKCRTAGKAELLADNINAWMGTTERRMLRTQKGAVRAMVSDRYLRIDNDFVLGVAKERLNANGLDLRDPSVVKRCHISDTRLYLQVNVPHQVAEIKKGDRVIQGLILSNSEVGASAFTVEPFLWRLVCSNGLIAPQALTRIHLGAKNDVGIMSETTMDLEKDLLKSKVTDIIDSVFNLEVFEAWVEQLKGTTEVHIPKPTETLDAAFDNFGLFEDLKPKVLDEIIREGDNTQYGLVNALTAVARDVPNFEDMVTMERVAGEISMMKEGEFIKKLCTV